MNFIHPFRIQILGAAEIAYLAALAEDEVRAAIDRLFAGELIAAARRERRDAAALPRAALQRRARPAAHVAAAVAAPGRRVPLLPRARARRVDDAARRVPGRAGARRADHRRLGDRQERAGARAHLARQRPGRRRHRRALSHLPGHRRGPLPRRAEGLPRGARHRRAQHPHDLRRDRDPAAQAAAPHRAPRGPQPRERSPSSTASRSTRRSRRCSACRSAA